MGTLANRNLIGLSGFEFLNRLAQGTHYVVVIGASFINVGKELCVAVVDEPE